ncbi:MAG TPA: ATP-binding protein [Oculatellaceae cyanobacterium]|jgi:two-component system phosphate regulon sensor histidine kinase PhoR
MTEALLRNTSAQLKQVLNEQPILMMLLKEFRDGILICDGQGAILHFNQSLKSFLHLRDSDVGRSARDVIRNEAFSKLLNTAFETKSAQVEEIPLNDSLGREMFFELHVVPIAIADAKTQVSGCVIIFHDMTDIRRTEKMRRDFVANVSHELRTPLSAIKGYSETLLDGALEDPEVCRDFIGVIHRHSLRLAQLVDDLLDLSKLESPDYQPEFSPVVLAPLVQQVLALVHDKAEAKQISVHVDCPESLPKVSVDVSSMQQVLTNLLDNAIKYTPTEGKVFIRAFLTPQGKVQVDIEDTGIGIEAKYFPRIFERFYRVDKARSRDLGGTGLGLAIVKHIVQLHGGEIWIASVPNQGTTFSFTLNIAN